MVSVSELPWTLPSTPHTHFSVVRNILLPFPQQQVDDRVSPSLNTNHCLLNHRRTTESKQRTLVHPPHGQNSIVHFWQTWLTHSIVPTILTLLFAFIISLIPRLPRSGTQTLKLCRPIRILVWKSLGMRLVHNHAIPTKLRGEAWEQDNHSSRTECAAASTSVHLYKFWKEDFRTVLYFYQNFRLLCLILFGPVPLDCGSVL